MPKFTERLRRAWNVFTNKNPTRVYTSGYSGYYRPDRFRMSRGSERSIVSAIYNRIAIDVAAVTIEHVKLGEDGMYEDSVKSSLNEALTLESNKDQTARSFIRDLVFSLLDEGCVAVVPVDHEEELGEIVDVYTMRVGQIMEWFPDQVRVRVYNDRTGNKEDILLPKSKVSIIDNPFYETMNEPNSTLQRLIRKINLLDAIDEQSGSGKLDIIIQLPYPVTSPTRKIEAESRRKDIEQQLAGSKYGIAYTGATEHITQLNRPAENNLLSQIEYLTNMLYSQLGLTPAVFDGSASEEMMLNYYNRTIEPILAAIAGEFRRKFLTKEARDGGETIMFFRDPFSLASAEKVAEMADTFTRNEILSSNEFRSILGKKRSQDKRADMLLNKNLNHEGEVVDSLEGTQQGKTEDQTVTEEQKE